MNSLETKSVCYLITVPDSMYCWEYKVSGSCEFFDNEGGGILIVSLVFIDRRNQI